MQRLSDVQGEGERAPSSRHLHAELRAVWQRELQLLDELTDLLDDAQRALCEAPAVPWRVCRGTRLAGDMYRLAAK